jgi:hypothetical protein
MKARLEGVQGFEFLLGWRVTQIDQSAVSAADKLPSPLKPNLFGGVSVTNRT